MNFDSKPNYQTIVGAVEEVIGNGSSYTYRIAAHYYYSFYEKYKLRFDRPPPEKLAKEWILESHERAKTFHKKKTSKD